MGERRLAELSMDFAVEVLTACEGVRGHRSLVDQLERSASSIGANIHEANYAHSKADFAAKLQIALKECYETEYWLTLFTRVGLFTPTPKDLLTQCGTIRRKLISSLTTTKNKSSPQGSTP